MIVSSHADYPHEARHFRRTQSENMRAAQWRWRVKPPQPPLLDAVKLVGIICLGALILGFMIPEVFSFVKWVGDILIGMLK